MQGTISKLFEHYGFIRSSSGTKYFFHRCAVVGLVPFDQIKPGDVVQFEPEAGPISLSAPRAAHVRHQPNTKAL